LLDNELAVAVHREARYVSTPRFVQAHNESSVFGHIVCFARPHEFGISPYLNLVAVNNCAGARPPGIAFAAPVK
jgi:hypothetical protein